MLNVHIFFYNTITCSHNLGLSYKCGKSAVTFFDLVYNPLFSNDLFVCLFPVNIQYMELLTKYERWLLPRHFSSLFVVIRNIFRIWTNRS